MGGNHVVVCPDVLDALTAVGASVVDGFAGGGDSLPTGVAVGDSRGITTIFEVVETNPPQPIHAEVAMNKYPANWPEIAREVKDRANWRCQCCHHPHESKSVRRDCVPECAHPADDLLRGLGVHHLDDNKANCHWSNLVALCQVCHLRMQGRVYPTVPLVACGHWLDVYIAGRWAARLGFDDSREYVTKNVKSIFTALGVPYAKSA